MYAVITSGGKQYKVTKGQTLKLEKLTADIGGIVEFPALMIFDKEKEKDQLLLGSPHIANRNIKAEVISHGRGEKIKIIKMRRRKHSRKQMGHRQSFTEVKVTEI